MSALTDYLASADADERVKRWHERWGDDEEWRIDADAALNALCEQLATERSMVTTAHRHENAALKASDEQRHRAERAEARIRELEAENAKLRERAHVECDEYEYLTVDGMCHKGGNGPLCPNEPRCHLIDEHKRARVAELEAENARLKEVVGTARAFLDANPALNGTGPLRGDVEAYEQESKPTDVCPRCGGCGEEYPSESVPCSVCGGIGEQEAKP